MTLSKAWTIRGDAIATESVGFAQIKRDRKTMTREQAAKKWNCSPGTIDKYAS